MYTTVDAPNTILQYKGKLAHRSWPQLPQEIVRLIATHYLYDLAVNTYCPQTWETRRLWPSRMVYTCIRDSLELEKHIMSICPEWHRAVAKHPFWKQAVSLLDGNDYLLHHMVIHPKPSLNASSMALPPPIYLSHYQHFRNIVGASCHVCRINYPGTNLGLTAAKKFLLNSMLGTVHLCREHDRRRTHFCGLCLRDSFPPGHQDPVREYEMAQAFGILENEDEDTWAGVEATCKKCRMEWLWRRASHSPRDQEAIGGPNFQSSDWETRQCLEGFIDLAEGNIAEVLTLAREKLWLKRYTKYESLGLHALAAQKSHGDDRGQEELEEEYVEEDSEEDKELMLMKDANQVRELALHDWARQRILDGHWMSPADIWYHHQVPGQPSSVQAVHPCPWAREGSEVGTTASGGEEDEEHTETQHPHPAIVAGEVPPTYQLCEQAYAAHMKQMREILLHPLRNVVRKIVMECSIPTVKGYEDPGLRARRMSLEEVVSILREEEGVWYDGVDWIERRRNEEEEERRRKEAQLRKEKEYDEDSSIAASSPSNKSTPSSTHTSSSSHSNATSPVLSTTTLQTTPSPPPSSDVEGGLASKKDEDGSAPSQRESESESDAAPSRPPPPPPPPRPRIIPVDPVRSPPLLLSSIPYIPVTTAHLPQFSSDAIRIVWRDACAPLYHCRCSICERAKLAESAARAAYAAANAPTIVPSQYQYQQQQQPVRSYPPIAIRGNINSDSNATVNIDAAEIELKEVSEIELDGEGEEEVDYDASDLEYDDEEEEEDEDDLRYARYMYSASPEVEAEVDVVDLVSDAEGDLEQGHEREQAPSPRPRKRSCDELELADAQADAIEAGQDPDDNSIVESPFFRRDDRREHGTPPKRARLGDVDRDPVSPLEEDGDGLAGGDIDGDTGLSTFPIGVNHDPMVSPVVSPTRLRKRSSEELEDGPDDQQYVYVHAHGVGSESGQGPPGNASNKRAKVDHPTSLVASPASLASDLNGEGEDRSALGVGLGGKGKAACSPAPPSAVVGTLLQVEEVPAEREDEECEEEIDKPYLPPRMWSRAPSHRAGPTG